MKSNLKLGIVLLDRSVIDSEASPQKLRFGHYSDPKNASRAKTLA